ncbi:NmrA/HSCARG family protein [Polyangium sp. 15x6]|uniref:NmrA/HSCARG family protein n=1 Tax=Polyangium sp. 15x6 TaxID=3042687 RepID=UPI00249CBBBD|nr:NmrA/HSCARG family protein [Polyangium sp. 15x6]MDI3289028.1 NmrA/HSCARG family protein [Polyangium sp. 15x6]
MTNATTTDSILAMGVKASDPILVTGATGRQGGAVARALLARGAPVHALVRDVEASGARALGELGATLVRGDFDDPASLRAACAGARGVFSVQMPNLKNLEGDDERRQGENLVEAARAAGVPQFVHTSVSGSGEYQRRQPGWGSPASGVHYWESKEYTENLVRSAGFRSFTLLKPPFFMENFVRPSFLFANWVEDRLLTVLAPDTVLSLVAMQDIGAAAAAAFTDPATWNGVELEIAGDRLSMREIAAVLSEVLGTPIEAPSLTAEEALAQGLLPIFVVSQQRMNVVDSPARPEHARAHGLATTDFRTWAKAHLGRTEAAKPAGASA